MVVEKEVHNMHTAKFLSWCKSYKQEVQEFEHLIAGNPEDVELLKHEYYELTGEEYND